MIVGLTGGIGSGKTAVANIFAQLDVPVIDADVIAAQLTEPGQPSYEKIIEYFGSDILTADKTLDRKRLREIIFCDKSKREWLESLLHPIILSSIQSSAANLQAPYCIVVTPLLAEIERKDLVNRVLVVDLPEAQQIERASRRDNVLATQVKNIMQAQTTRAQRLEIADDVIDNQGSLDELFTRVYTLHQKYLKMSRRT